MEFRFDLGFAFRRLQVILITSCLTHQPFATISYHCDTHAVFLWPPASVVCHCMLLGLTTSGHPTGQTLEIRLLFGEDAGVLDDLAEPGYV